MMFCGRPILTFIGYQIELKTEQMLTTQNENRCRVARMHMHEIDQSFTGFHAAAVGRI